jgi:hypothetical protein
MATSTKTWARKITSAWQKSVDAIFQCGGLLIAAKGKLKHGEFQKMIESELPFGPRTAEMLMAIADDRRLAKAKRASLPASWYTLYKLTRLSDEDFERALADGTINAEMTRDDVPATKMTVTIVEPETPDTTKILPASPVSASAPACSVVRNPALPSPISVSVGPNPALPSPSFTVIRSDVDHLIDLLEPVHRN